MVANGSQIHKQHISLHLVLSTKAMVWEAWRGADLFSGPAEAHVSGGTQLHYLLL